MSKRDLSLKKYNIGTYRYRELLYFCLQYEEFKKNSKENAELIENTAKEAAGTLWEQLLKNVSLGIVYEHMPIPMGRKQFYEMRRRFFWLLSQRKE